MPYIPSEQVAAAKTLDLLSYLQAVNPNELVRINENQFCTKTHDSLKISNGKWMWWSQGIGGKSAVDYLIAVEGMTFYEAVRQILEYKNGKLPDCNVADYIAYEKKLIMPPCSPTNLIVKNYLKNRGIAENIIDDCIRDGSIYESLPGHNVVFVGFDEDHNPRCASLRGTWGSNYKREVYGSDKKYSFRITNRQSETVHLFEGAIDLLSFATMMQNAKRDWKNETLLSLSGVYTAKQYDNAKRLPVALAHFLETNPQIKMIRMHLDNDRAGRNATTALTALLKDRYTVVDRPVPQGKDVNDYLCYLLRNRKRAGKETTKER